MTIKRHSLVRVGDGTGKATVESITGDEVRIRYDSGARRTVHRRNVAEPKGATPAEQLLLEDLTEAGEGGLVCRGYERRVAICTLRDAGYLIEELGGVVLLTKAGEEAARRVLGVPAW